MDLVALQNSLDNLSFAVLLVTMLLYWSGMAFPRIPYLPALGTAGMAIANLSIASLLGARWIEAGYFPLSNLYESLFFIAWGLTATHLLAEYLSRSRWVGAVASPVAMGITAFAALSLPDTMQVAEPLVPALQSNWLMMHVSVMLLSYACLMVGSLLAIAFLIVTRGQAVSLAGSSYGNGNRRQTPLNQMETVSDLPAVQFSSNGSAIAERSQGVTTLERIALETTPTWSPETLSLAQVLDNISYRMIGLGFPLLTIGIIAGGVWANEAWGSYWSWDPKETWALITWLVFAAYLHARITKGWQGRRPAILAAAGFCVVWVCYMGVNLLGKGLHSYGWFF
ncbi:MAG: c-type cytochrome biogenesis protein CcsB [Roseofilum sp. SBFL]|uniref:c-type cytochrome biogenesis protein CcsB n=1 Tax=unclassified Roseofilum TaxID=2620099 RepID=UPI001B2206B5|nr:MULTISPECIES: c-type cytochrome biogenesis protein CcsB [unclassified Roseofilum]MBP0014362.1 c-type cytochrome biogenesis protein CcsB [Roseofilum sp. SID3]MBP0022527.1 c-type cytochrome biogenesis protein CcsB [Roseofilum sp. SID2]MBP0038812.1 c-type cytochrome biogenesis protein CcsB [Roseofilum sp. SID1]MBP0042207.1 c-type cytochrome biogenesis protein CcsB [Roseofilum sp. SBFL]